MQRKGLRTRVTELECTLDALDDVGGAMPDASGIPYVVQVGHVNRLEEDMPALRTAVTELECTLDALDDVGRAA